jgi:hypothetical protein
VNCWFGGFGARRISGGSSRWRSAAKICLQRNVEVRRPEEKDFKSWWTCFSGIACRFGKRALADEKEKPSTAENEE